MNLTGLLMDLSPDVKLEVLKENVETVDKASRNAININNAMFNMRNLNVNYQCEKFGTKAQAPVPMDICNIRTGTKKIDTVRSKAPNVRKDIDEKNFISVRKSGVVLGKRGKQDHLRKIHKLGEWK